MKVKGRLQMAEGQAIDNLTIPSGNALPEGSFGELFYLVGHATLSDGIYKYDGQLGAENWNVFITWDGASPSDSTSIVYVDSADYACTGTEDYVVIIASQDLTITLLSPETTSRPLTILLASVSNDAEVSVVSAGGHTVDSDTSVILWLADTAIGLLPTILGWKLC